MNRGAWLPPIWSSSTYTLSTSKDGISPCTTIESWFSRLAARTGECTGDTWRDTKSARPWSPCSPHATSNTRAKVHAKISNAFHIINKKKIIIIIIKNHTVKV
jgi:hypothetical protein